MKCFYHNDLDGHCAAAIVKEYYTTVSSKYYEMDYSKSFPFDIIQKNEMIVIVDFSLSSIEDWKKLLTITPFIIWIDHHITAIEKYKELNLKGIQDIRAAGCELTWEYYFLNIKVPLVVTLLGDYDTWTLRYKEDSEALQLGIKLENTYPENDMWSTWFYDNDLIRHFIENGKLLLKFREQQYAEVIRSQAYFIQFEGYTAVVCNSHERGSQLFASVSPELYDIMMPFCWNGKKWTVSLYTTKDIDVSTIALKYGGGGHKNAAGFICDYPPFLKKIN